MTTNFTPPRRSPSKQVRDFIAEQISSGAWKPGDYLPAEVELAGRFHVHRLTVNAVIRQFVREGYLERHRGVGTRLREPKDRSSRVTKLPMVGLVTHHPIEMETNAFYGQIQEVLRQKLLAGGYFLLPLGSAESPVAEVETSSCDVHRSLAGFVFLGPVTPTMSTRFRTDGQSCVFVGCSEGLEQGDSNVSTDDEIDSELLTQKFLDAGHRQLVHLNASPPFRMEARLGGFLRAMEKAGIPVPYRYVTEASAPEHQAGYNAMRTFCETGLPFTGVYGSNDVLALGALAYLEESGRKVPEEVSVAGFDGITTYPMYGRRLTTMKIDRLAMGEKAAALLLEQLEGGSGTSSVRLRSEYVPGETMAAPGCADAVARN